MNLKLYFLLFYSSFLFSQNFIEKQLPSPDNMSVFFGGDLFNSTIHYGRTPANFNGEVILFNHGYIDLNQFFLLIINSMNKHTMTVIKLLLFQLHEDKACGKTVSY